MKANEIKQGLRYMATGIASRPVEVEVTGWVREQQPDGKWRIEVTATNVRTGRQLRLKPSQLMR